MSKNLDTKIFKTKDLGRDALALGDRQGLDHLRRFEFMGQGQMSHVIVENVKIKRNEECVGLFLTFQTIDITGDLR
jgi:hypothetical protein